MTRILKINLAKKKRKLFFYSWLLLFLITGIWFFGFSKNIAQAQTLNINDVNTTSLTSNSVVITWTTTDADGKDVNADSRVNYGTTSSYGSSVYSLAKTNIHVMTVGGLNSSTTYHFQVVSSYKINEGTANEETIQKSSTDRNFTTTSGTGETNAPTVTTISIDATVDSATFTVTTSKQANITITYWPPSGSQNSVSEPAGSYALNHSLNISGLLRDTTYTYFIKSVDSSTNWSNTANFTFKTPLSGTDHIFTTGQCEGNVEIGACVGDFYCSAGSARLIHDCTKCNFNCSAGSTCRSGGDCSVDPALTGSAYQCNDSTTCYDNGGFTTPADANCYASWPKCNANVVLKVKRDRECSKWLTCKTSLTVTNPKTNKKENLCYQLTACNSLSSSGECNNYIDMPAENQTYKTPEDIAKIKNLTGSIVAGLDWHQQSGDQIIQGYFPWSAMSEEGSYIPELNINGNFEKINSKYNPCDTETATTTPCDKNKYDKRPWENSPGSYKKDGNSVSSDIISVIEDPQDSSRFNHVLEVNPLLTTEAVQSGARAIVGSTSTASTYAVSMKLRAASSGDQKISVRFRTALITRQCSKESTTKSGEECNTDSDCPSGVCEETITSSGTIEMAKQCSKESSTPGLACKKDGDCPGGTCQDLVLTAGWKEYAFEAEGTGGETYLEIVSISDPRGIFYVDDVTIKPILKVSADVKLPRSCRLYPKEDSLYCEYSDKDTGIYYKGWYGYCLEKDSQNPNLCLSWWPVDLLSGESDIFGNEVAAGYTDRTPLYYCAESKGKSGQYSAITTRADWCNSPDCPDFFSPTKECKCPDQDKLFGAVDGSGVTFWIPPGPDETVYKNYEIDKIALTAYPWNFGAAPNADLLFLTAPNWETTVCCDKGQCYKGGVAGCPADYITMSSLYGNSSGCNNLSIPGTADNRNGFSVKAGFDPATGAFNGLLYTMCHDMAGNGGIFFNTTFYAGEVCTKIVKVVSGPTNKAWASRVSKASKYKVPGLNYTYGSDYAPFGGALVDDPQDQPEIWGSPLFAEAPMNDPNREKTLSQVRSGSPYSCMGNCSGKTCVGGTNDNKACKVDKDCPAPTGEPEKHGVCVGVGTCSNSLTACRDDSQCGGGLAVCIGGGASYQNLTTMSPWWSGPLEYGRCTLSQTKACSQNSDCAGVGSCDFQKKCANSSNPGATCSVNSACPNGTCAYPDEFVCVKVDPPAPQAQFSGKPCWSSTDCGGASCASRYADARLERLFAEAYGVWDLDPTTGKYVAEDWGSGSTSNVGWKAPSAVCPAGQRPAFPNDYCGIVPRVKNIKLSAGLSAEKESNNKIEVNTKSVNVYLQFNTEADAEQLPLKTIYIRWGDEPGKCDGGVNKGNKCTVHEDCPDSYCNRVCFGGAKSGQYCSSDFDCPGAYCSPNYKSHPFGFAPRSDPAKPHIYTHAYQCDKDLCVFYPKIAIEDNWGWCSNYPEKRPTWLEDVWPRSDKDYCANPTDLTLWDPVSSCPGGNCVDGICDAGKNQGRKCEALQVTLNP